MGMCGEVDLDDLRCVVGDRPWSSDEARSFWREMLEWGA